MNEIHLSLTRIPWRSIASAALVFTGAHLASAQEVILEYNLDGKPVDQHTAEATTVAPGLSASGLGVGAGVQTANLTNGFSSTGWDTITDGSNDDDGNPTAVIDGPTHAIDNDEYLEFSVTVDDNDEYVATFLTLDTHLRRSALNGPMYYQWQYSFDDFATDGKVIPPAGPIWDEIVFPQWIANPDLNIPDGWFYFQARTGGSNAATTPYQYTWQSTDATEGEPIPTIDLSGIAELQAVPEGTTVTFRLYAYGNPKTTQTNSVAFGRFQGPKITGKVQLASEIVTGVSTDISTWGFESAAHTSGMDLTTPADGEVALTASDPEADAVNDLRVRGGFDRVTLESGDSVSLTGQFTVSHAVQVPDAENVLADFESAAFDGGSITAAFKNSTSDPGFTLTTSPDSTEGSGSLSVAYNFIADEAWGGSIDIEGAGPYDLSETAGIAFDYKVVGAANPAEGITFYFKLIDDSDDVDEHWEVQVAEVVSDASGAWKSIVLDFDDFTHLASSAPGNGELDLDSIKRFQLQVFASGVGNTYAGEFLIDNLTTLRDSDVSLSGAQTRFALFDTGDTGGSIGTGDDAGIWVGGDSAYSGYVTVLRTSGDVSWSEGEGVAGAVLEGDWADASSTNVGIGGGNQNQVADEENPGEMRDAIATAGTYTFEITVTPYWDSRARIDYRIAGGTDGYVLEGSVIDDGVNLDGTISSMSFNGAGFSFDDSVFTDLVFEDVTVTVFDGAPLNRETLFTFENTLAGWQPNTRNNIAQASIARDDTGGEGRLAITPTGSGARWAARVDMPINSFHFENLFDALNATGYLNPLGIEFELTFLTANSNGYTGAVQYFAAVEQDSILGATPAIPTIEFWHQAILGSVTWDSDQTVTGVLPLAGIEINPDTEAVSLVVGLAAGTTDYTVLLDNVKLVELDITAENRSAAAEEFFDADANNDDMVDAGAMGTLWMPHFPWVYSYNLHEVRGGTLANPVGWLYAYGTNIDELAWFYDHTRADWWFTVESVYPWVYSTDTATWVNIEAEVAP